MTYEYWCPECDITTEEKREMPDRHRPAVCPKCKGPSRKIMSRTNFNPIFVGSTRAEMHADKYTRMSIEAQAEGFGSKMELDEARGQAQDRARAMGQPNKQLIGPVETPIKTEQTASPKELAIANILAQRRIKAAQRGDKKALEAAVEAGRHHETTLRQKASSVKAEFKPKYTRDDHKDQIKQSRSMRGNALT